MKRAIAILMALGMIFGLAACGTANTETTASSDAAATVSPETTKAPETTENPETTNAPETTAPATTAQETTAPQTTKEPGVVVIPDVKFDEKNIVYSFGAISDIHQDGRIDSDAGKKLDSALRQLSAQARVNDINGLDAICIAGDIADSGKEAQVKQFKQTYENALGKGNVSLFYSPGNHDQIGNAGGNDIIKSLYTEFGKSYFSNDVGTEEQLLTGNRHAVMGGYHFIAVDPDNYSAGTNKFSAETLEWLRNELKAAAEDKPGQYIFVFTHAMIYNTCYGSDLKGKDSSWNTSELTDILSLYPQTVTFGGHLHFPLNDERSIMQGSFTSLGCGSVSYMAIEDGGYIDMVSETVMKDRYEYSQGLLVQIDASGNVRFTRMDFYNGTTIKTPWEIEAPAKNNGHLNSYSAARGNSVNNQAPVLDGELNVTLSPDSDAYVMNIDFDSAKDDDLIHHYELAVYKNGRLINTIKILADFYRHQFPVQMKSEWFYRYGRVAKDCEFRITLTAYDSWQTPSNVLEKTVTTGDGTDTPETPVTEVPVPYGDIDFTDAGTINDKYEALKATLSKAEIAKTALTFAGKSAEVNALNVNALNQCATVEFAKLGNSSSAMRDFMQKGFSVEALFVNKSVSGSQGVVCGTQNGNWGVATDGTGKLYAGAYINNSFKKVTSKNALPDDALTHAVAVFSYDIFTNFSTITLYVNGVMQASGSFEGAFTPCSISGATTKFCLGADIDAYGTGTDFMMSSFTLCDAKIYNTALNDAQCANAYTAAVETFK